MCDVSSTQFSTSRGSTTVETVFCSSCLPCERTKCPRNTTLGRTLHVQHQPIRAPHSSLKAATGQCSASILPRPHALLRQKLRAQQLILAAVDPAIIAGATQARKDAPALPHHQLLIEVARRQPNQDLLGVPRQQLAQLALEERIEPGDLRAAAHDHNGAEEVAHLAVVGARAGAHRRQDRRVERHGGHDAVALLGGAHALGRGVRRAAALLVGVIAVRPRRPAAVARRRRPAFGRWRSYHRRLRRRVQLRQPRQQVHRLVAGGGRG